MESNKSLETPRTAPVKTLRRQLTREQVQRLLDRENLSEYEPGQVPVYPMYTTPSDK